MEKDFRNNENKRRFELQIGDDVAFIDYSHKDGVYVLKHTEVPSALQGQGVAGRLTNATLEWIKDNNIRFAAVCPYVAGYVSKHPEWRSYASDKE